MPHSFSFFFITATLTYNSHTRKFTLFKYTIQWFLEYSQTYAAISTCHFLKNEWIGILKVTGLSMPGFILNTFLWINSHNPPYKCMKWVLVLSPFYRKVNWDPDPGSPDTEWAFSLSLKSCESIKSRTEWRSLLNTSFMLWIKNKISTDCLFMFMTNLLPWTKMSLSRKVVGRPLAVWPLRCGEHLTHFGVPSSWHIVVFHK